VDLRIVIDKATVLEHLLCHNEIDLWLGYYTLQNEQLQYTFLYKDQLCLVVSKKLMSHLFGGGDNEGHFKEVVRCFETGLDISYFKHVPFLMIPRGTRQRSFVDHYLKKNHVVPSIALEADDNETLMLLALKGSYVTFSPIALIQRYEIIFEGEQAYFFPINDTSLQQDIIISSNPSKPLSTEAQNFIAVCQELLHQR
jgi:DNA-binding transcriptional LysR family regulator